MVDELNAITFTRWQHCDGARVKTAPRIVVVMFNIINNGRNDTYFPTRSKLALTYVQSTTYHQGWKKPRFFGIFL